MLVEVQEEHGEEHGEEHDEKHTALLEEHTQVSAQIQALKRQADELTEECDNIDLRVARALKRLQALDSEIDESTKALLASGDKEAIIAQKLGELFARRDKAEAGLVSAIGHVAAAGRAVQVGAHEEIAAEQAVLTEQVTEADVTSNLLQLSLQAQDLQHQELELAKAEKSELLSQIQARLHQKEEDGEDCDETRAELIGVQGQLEEVEGKLKQCLDTKVTLQQKIDQASQAREEAERLLGECLARKSTLKEQLEECHTRRDAAREKLETCLENKKTLAAKIETCHTARDLARKKLEECLSRKGELKEKIEDALAKLGKKAGLIQKYGNTSLAEMAIDSEHYSALSADLTGALDAMRGANADLTQSISLELEATQDTQAAFQTIANIAQEERQALSAMGQASNDQTALDAKLEDDSGEASSGAAVFRGNSITGQIQELAKSTAALR